MSTDSDSARVAIQETLAEARARPMLVFAGDLEPGMLVWLHEEWCEVSATNPTALAQVDVRYSDGEKRRYRREHPLVAVGHLALARAQEGSADAA